MMRNAMVGAAVWALILMTAQWRWLELGWIELVFLFAPLVIVPLGLELTKRAEPGLARPFPERIASSIQLPCAGAACVSFLMPRGQVSASLAAMWLLLCALLALGSALRIYRGGLRHLGSAFPVVAFLYLPVGGAWLVASRLGFTPMNFQEPVVLLTAVHFHYAGFAAALLARSVYALLIRSMRHSSAFVKSIAIGVLIGPGLLAGGFVIGPRTKLFAALVVTLSEIGLAFCFALAIWKIGDLKAKFLIGLAAASVVFSMVLAGLWAIGEYPLQPFVHLAEMARLHGTANAFGFTLCGLLGFVHAAKADFN